MIRGLKARYRDERAELRALAAALRPDDVALDIGANKGSYLWTLSRAVPRGRVHAIEPQPVLADYLRRVCAASGMRNVTVTEMAFSDRPGDGTLAIPGGGASSPGASLEPGVREREDGCRTVTVPLATLDAWISDVTAEAPDARIGAIKIDVEGHELAVLEGGAATIARHRPVIVCESEGRHLPGGDVLAVLGWFRDHGYDGHFVERGQLRPLDGFDPAEHQRAEGDRFWDAPGYCNNFVLWPCD